MLIFYLDLNIQYTCTVYYAIQYIGIHWGVSIKDTAYSTGIRTAYNMTCRQTLC